MAVKKTTKKKDESATPTAKAEATEAAPKKKSSRPKKAAAAPAPAPDASTAEAKPAKSPAPKKGAAKKAAAPVKLSTSQTDLLKKISESPEAGYAIGKKIEQRSIDTLLEKKLIKKGAKNKETGNIHYLISSAGKKHVDAGGA